MSTQGGHPTTHRLTTSGIASRLSVNEKNGPRSGWGVERAEVVLADRWPLVASWLAPDARDAFLGDR
jgi:hypothetical protein